MATFRGTFVFALRSVSPAFDSPRLHFDEVGVLSGRRYVKLGLARILGCPVAPSGTGGGALWRVWLEGYSSLHDSPAQPSAGRATEG